VWWTGWTRFPYERAQRRVGEPFEDSRENKSSLANKQQTATRFLALPFAFAMSKCVKPRTHPFRRPFSQAHRV
jgi:hypothetical protein